MHVTTTRTARRRAGPRSLLLRFIRCPGATRYDNNASPSPAVSVLRSALPSSFCTLRFPKPPRFRLRQDHGIDENGEWEGLPREERSSSSAASRTTGAVLRGAGPTSTKPGTSPVNPYSAAARGGGKGSPAALRAQAAEARIEKLKAGNEKRESASVSASVATTAKTGKVATGGAFAGGGAVDGDRAVAGGSKRGRQLQERCGLCVSVSLWVCTLERGLRECN